MVVEDEDARGSQKDIQNRSPRDVNTLPSRETPSRERMVIVPMLPHDSKIPNH